MSMFRYTLRSVARRTLSVRLPGSRIIPVLRTAPSLRSEKHSSATDGNAAQSKKQLDESQRDMDIDAAEKHMRYWFGDHDTWDHEKLLNLKYVDDLISAQDMMRFADYAVGGYRPDGDQPSFPLMTQEELVLVDTPYHRWAPAPYNTLSYSCHERLAPMFMNTGDGNDIKTPPYADFFARLLPLRAKLWHGMVPMSHDRWLQKKMDDPKNYRNLFELMNDILTIFIWLNHEKILNRMRYGFNWLVDKYIEFEGAANLRREQNGISERLNFAGLWAEYYHAVISNMSNRTHQWLVDRVDEVQTRAFAEYTAALKEAGSNEEAIGNAGRTYYECVQDLNSMKTKADYMLALPMTGFKGYTSSNSALDLELPVRQDVYGKIAATKSWKHQETILKAQDEEEKTADKEPKNLSEKIKYLREPPPAGPRFRDHDAFVGHYHEGKKNRIEMRRAFRGEPKALSEEYWITVLKERMNFYLQNGKDPKTHRWGFVCYRLTYEQDDAEWAAFKSKFEADVFKSGRWIEGYDSIADMASLTYIDGRDVGIAEGDIEAAKRHFKSTYTMLPTLGRMWTQDFLVVDHQSYASYANPEPEDKPPPVPYGPCFGDRGGFVRLVDTIKYNEEMLDATSPGFKGEVKVLSSLVLEELYPLLATYAVRPRSLWPLARLHPREVYVGHTINAQEAWWEFNRIDKVHMNKAFFEHLKKKKAELKDKE